MAGSQSAHGQHNKVQHGFRVAAPIVVFIQCKFLCKLRLLVNLLLAA